MPSGVPEEAIEVRETADGLRWVITPCPESPLACVVLRVGVGSAHEQVHERGLAHVLEHVLVRCGMRGGRVADGAVVSARTGKDSTVFSVVVREADLTAAVAVVGSVFRDLDVPEHELAAELAAIAEERRQRSAQAAWQVRNALFRQWWAGTAAEHSVLGDPAVLGSLTPEKLDVFHKTWYRRAHATISIAADPGAARRAVAAEPIPRSDLTGHAVGTERPDIEISPARLWAESVAAPLTGIGLVTGRESREMIVLACDAVLAASPVRIEASPLGRWSCVWTIVKGVRPGAVRSSVLDALTATRQRVMSTDGASWLRAEAVIPRLRCESGIEAQAGIAADPRLAVNTDVLLQTTPTEIGRVLGSWSRQLEQMGLESTDTDEPR